MADLARDMADALGRGSLDDLGSLVGEHWIHQRSLHPRITTPDIERTLRAALDAGARGGKALGASGGGCVVAIADRGREGDVREAMAGVATLLPFTVDREGVRVERATQGATV
jgi:D-glycero-alpha-D-manno-heptose-7-phosphate kinase